MTLLASCRPSDFELKLRRRSGNRKDIAKPVIDRLVALRTIEYRDLWEPQLKRNDFQRCVGINLAIGIRHM